MRSKYVLNRLININHFQISTKTQKEKYKSHHRRNNHTIDKALFGFNLAVNVPFYAIVIKLTLMGVPVNPSIDHIDFARYCLRSIFLTQSINCGITLLH